MTYTKDNPKLVNYYFNFKGYQTFTGVVKDKDNSFAYYLNGQLHREDGPAVDLFNYTSKLWYLNGKRHREDGPAVEYFEGDKEWWLNNKLHRTDGAAIELADGRKSWFLNGKHYGSNYEFTNESWIRFIKIELFK